MRVTSCGITDVGMKRLNNEDNYLINDDLRLFVVADGMGGHAGGEYASQIAVTTVEEVLLNIQDERIGESLGDEDVITQEKLRYAIRLAGKRIYERAQENADYHGMGTTALVLLLKDGRSYIAHVGDSRCYHFRDGTVSQLTEDHSWVNEQIKAGLISKESARTHKLRNIITRSLGYFDEVDIDTQVQPLAEGDAFLLCSDGLSNLVEEEELRDIVEGHPVQEAARRLVELANKRGGDDNITVVLARIDSL